MDGQPAQAITLNVNDLLPDEAWRSIDETYKLMPEWRGYRDGIPYWFGDEGDPQFLWVSIEPAGLLVSGVLGEELWEAWIGELMARLSGVLGREVRDASA